MPESLPVPPPEPDKQPLKPVQVIKQSIEDAYRFASPFPESGYPSSHLIDDGPQNHEAGGVTGAIREGYSREKDKGWRPTRFFDRLRYREVESVDKTIEELRKSQHNEPEAYDDVMAASAVSFALNGLARVKSFPRRRRHNYVTNKKWAEPMSEHTKAKEDELIDEVVFGSVDKWLERQAPEVQVRWADKVDPANVSKLREKLIYSQRGRLNRDSDIKNEERFIKTVGINITRRMNNRDRERIIADYFDIPYDRNLRREVPKEIFDQVNLLIKLDESVLKKAADRFRLKVSITQPSEYESPISHIVSRARIRAELLQEERVEQSRRDRRNMLVRLIYSGRLDKRSLAQAHAELARLDEARATGLEMSGKDSGPKAEFDALKSELNDPNSELAQTVRDFDQLMKKKEEEGLSDDEKITFREVKGKLARRGIRHFRPNPGDTFNPSEHEISSGNPSDTVIHYTDRYGLQLDKDNSKILRPAQVQVRPT